MTESPTLWSGVLQRLESADVTPEHRLLIAFSGGLDSSVLVDLLNRARQRGGPAIELIHVDHGLRPDSASDARFCARQARQRGLPFHLERLNMDAEAGQSQARHRRLAAIADHALRRSIEHVAFGHHGDDRIETFLFHLRRGTGLDGLAAMPPIAAYPFAGVELCVVRPLVDRTREELEDYARRRSIPHIIDPTNATDAYTRNRIRHHLVPRLAEDSSRRHRVLDAIDRLDEERRAADHYAAKLAEHSRRPCANLGARAFHRPALADAPRATVARLFQGLEPTLDADAICRLHAAIEGPADAAPRHLTLSHCVVTVVSDRVVFEPSEERGGRDVLHRRAHPIFLRPFSRGSAPFFGATIQWSHVASPSRPDASPDQSEPSPWEATFDPRELHRPLEVTGLRPGARLPRRDISGDIFHQKLTNLLNEAGVPADVRWRWPCVYDAEAKLLWAAGLRRGVAAHPPSDDGPKWRISFIPSKELTEILQC